MTDKPDDYRTWLQAAVPARYGQHLDIDDAENTEALERIKNDDRLDASFDAVQKIATAYSEGGRPIPDWVDVVTLWRGQELAVCFTAFRSGASVTMHTGPEWLEEAAGSDYMIWHSHGFILDADPSGPDFDPDKPIRPIDGVPMAMANGAHILPNGTVRPHFMLMIPIDPEADPGLARAAYDDHSTFTEPRWVAAMNAVAAPARGKLDHVYRDPARCDDPTCEACYPAHRSEAEVLGDDTPPTPEPL